MSVVSCIKKNFADAVVTRCSERNCTLRLSGLSDYVVLKGERVFKSLKVCDCIIFTFFEGCLIIGLWS